MRKWLPIAVGLLVLAGLGWQVAGRPGLAEAPDWQRAVAWLPGLSAPSPASRAERSAPLVRVATSRAEEVPIVLTGIGTVQPYNMVGVRSRIDGEIMEIRFREGQDVKAGDVLAVIDPRPLQAQLSQTEATLAKDKALLAGALLDLNRSEALVVKNFATQQQVDQQRALVDQYRAQIRSDEAQIEYARTQLGYTSILSPIAGRTGIRQIDQGNYVRAGDAATLVTVSQVQPISVVFTLAAGSVAASRLQLGEAKVPVAVYAADDTTLLDRGFVELVDNQVDPATGTIKLKASFPNEKLRLWPGIFVNGRIVVERRRGVTIPAAALRHGPRGDYVFVLKEDSTVDLRSVRAGQLQEGRILVERGLRGGERVVTEGHFRLENGTRVEVAPESASDERGPAGSPGRTAAGTRTPG